MVERGFSTKRKDFHTDIKIEEDYQLMVDSQIDEYINKLINKAGKEYFEKHPDKKITEVPPYEVYKEIPEFIIFWDSMNYMRKINNLDEIEDDKLERLFDVFKDTVKDCVKKVGAITDEKIGKALEHLLTHLYCVNKTLSEIVDEAEQAIESENAEDTMFAMFEREYMGNDNQLDKETILNDVAFFRKSIIEPCFMELSRKAQLKEKTKDEIINAIKTQIPSKIQEGCLLV